MTTHTPECQCLHCGFPFSAATAVNTEDRPAEGNLTICILCGAVMAFDRNLRVRGLTQVERDQVTGDPQFMKELMVMIQGRVPILLAETSEKN